MFKFKRRIAVALIALLAAVGFTAVTTASSASATTSSCVGAWNTYSTKTLSTSWSYAGSTAKVTGVNQYQARSYCGALQIRSVLKLTASQGTYTKATSAGVRWSNGGRSNAYSFLATLISPTGTQTTSVSIGFENTRYDIGASKVMRFDS